MEPAAWSWYNTFDPLFNPLPNPDPTPTLPALRTLLSKLVSLGWALEDIHLFGWQQGGTMALELGLNVGREGVTIPASSASPSNPNAGSAVGKRLGSAISVCGKLESYPSTTIGANTPVLWFTRSDPRGAATHAVEKSLRRAFATVEVVRGSGTGADMPRGRGEWEGIMRFWGQMLRPASSGWKGEGEVYEVVQ